MKIQLDRPHIWSYTVRPNLVHIVVQTTLPWTRSVPNAKSALCGRRLPRKVELVDGWDTRDESHTCQSCLSYLLDLAEKKFLKSP